MNPPPPFWSLPVELLLARLTTSDQGLTTAQLRSAQARSGANLLKPRRRTNWLILLLNQFRAPVILILVAAAVLAFFLGDRAEALIIVAIVLASGLLGFAQEYRAADVVSRLLASVRTTATVLRDRVAREVALEDVVPGDVVLLAAGDSIPADGRLLEGRDLFVDEATLTGETYPVEKTPGVLAPETPLARRTNVLFLGTHVVSGTGRALVVATGRSTEFGRISQRLRLRPPETEFEHGVRRFGYFLMEVTLGLVAAIFVFNVFFHRPILDAFLFSLAIAVGLTPQLLPAIISINLARGATRMARAQVIVKRLAAIEDFGSMDVLCSDKTGTLTEAQVRVAAGLDVDGRASDDVLFHAYLNARYESGFVNPIDQAIREYRAFDLAGWRKLDEVPYDFVRKRLSILVGRDGTSRVVTKGAVANVLAVCRRARRADGRVVPLDAVRAQVAARAVELAGGGQRVLAVAMRDVGPATSITADAETDMTLLGMLAIDAPIKPDAARTIERLRALGVTLKIVTGDSRAVALHVADEVGLAGTRVLTGADLTTMSDAALVRAVPQCGVFAEVEPNQKERIILALRKAGHVVGYIGDGINDASALHVADVGISVESAVDAAKDAADIVLLKKDLGVLGDGVAAGRHTFANTLKYVFMATSANFGNMFSMAGASVLLPFLPLLPTQVLLVNFLTDLPEMTIATDRVDPEAVARPRRWDIRFIRNFMLTFGIVSSLFDFVTFGALFFLLHAVPAQFRSGWFVESVASAALIVLVIRTRRPFFRSPPSRALLVTTLLVVAAAVVLPATALARLFGFTPLPPVFLALVAAIVVLYATATEIAKRLFYRHAVDGRS